MPQLLAALSMIVFWLAAAIGWGMNLWAVASAFIHNAPFTTMFVGRIIGVFFVPLGAIMGYF